jgi:hypothetical protein
MHTRSPFLLALLLGSVHASQLDAFAPLSKRSSEALQSRAPSPLAADALSGLIEIRAPSDFDLDLDPDLAARTPTPVAALEPDTALDLVPAPAAEAAPEPAPLALDDDSPFLEYEGAEILQKRSYSYCPA